MFKVANVETKEADLIFAEFVEKIAFDATVLVPAIVGSLTGGLTSNKLMNKKHEQNAIRQKSNEKNQMSGNYYDDIGTLLNNLKVIFTPINVIFSVDGQTFEIISVSEMNEEMNAAHRRRDGDYFTGLLVNKMNMELQMAERYFARTLLQPHLDKQASHDLSIRLLSNEHQQPILLQKLASLANLNESVNIPVNFDNVRPFQGNDALSSFDKVAKVSSSFEVIEENDLTKGLEVKYLPDRILFIYNGTLIEQMSLMNMNEKGYQAFKRKDDNFFKSFFNEFSKEVQSEALKKQASDEEFIPELSTEFENDEFYKTAATLDERRSETDWVELLAFDKEFLNIFLDGDTHPIVYDMFLDSEYGGDWHEQEIEAIMKRIETDYLNNEPIPDQVFNKLLLIHTIQDERNSVFLTAFAFEKYVRAINNKSVQIDEVEGNVELEEIVFALDIAESVCEYNIYLDMTDSVAAYIATQLLEDNIRIIAPSVYYDEDNAFKNDFFEQVNGYLDRKWKDKDSHSLYGEESTATREISQFVSDAIIKILEQNAELLDFKQPYKSSEIVTRAYFSHHLDQYEEKEAIVRTISENIARHLLTIMFLEIKIQEAEFIYEKMKGSVNTEMEV